MLNTRTTFAALAVAALIGLPGSAIAAPADGSASVRPQPAATDFSSARRHSHVRHGHVRAHRFGRPYYSHRGYRPYYRYSWGPRYYRPHYGYGWRYPYAAYAYDPYYYRPAYGGPFFRFGPFAFGFGW